MEIDWERQARTLLDVVLTRHASAVYRGDEALKSDGAMFEAAMRGKASAYREIATLLDNMISGIEIKPPNTSSIRIVPQKEGRPPLARTPRGGMSTSRKNQVRARGGGYCHYCGEKPNQLEIEHVVPRCLGGTVALSNLVTACLPCNDEKGAGLWAGHCDQCDRAISIWMHRQIRVLWERWPLQENYDAAA